MKKNIAQVVVGLPVKGPFDYVVTLSQQETVAAGSRVKVPFGRRTLTGYVVGFTARSAYRRLKPVFSVLDSSPSVSAHALTLAKEVAGYYCCSWGEAIEMMVPAALRRGKEIDIVAPPKTKRLKRKKQTAVLVHDTTGVKCWPYLIEQIKAAYAAGQSVIFLVPEVSLVSFVSGRLRAALPDECVVYDKHTTHTKEWEQWRALREGRARIVIGSRSGVFAPTHNTGLIVVYDEEHHAYKQEQAPFYHARDVALMRAEIEGSRVILVSSAPSIETWQRPSKKLTRVTFTDDKRCAVQIIDMENYKTKRSATLTYALKNTIQKALAENKKIILFMNRRGFSTLIRCTKCGHTLVCPRCNVNLTYVYAQKKLACRLCNYAIERPAICPQCAGGYLRYTGAGIEKLESEVAREFPHARVALCDRQTKKIPAEATIIIATQAIAGMKEVLAVDIVGVINVDAELNRLDFRAAQKTFSLLMTLQRMAREKLVIQTRLPDNCCIKALRTGDARTFYRTEKKLRREVGLPPYVHLIALTVRAAKEAVAAESAQALYTELSKRAGAAIEVTEPQPGLQPKMRGTYRYALMLKGKKVAPMAALIEKARAVSKKRSGVHISVDVDA